MPINIVIPSLPLPPRLLQRLHPIHPITLRQPLTRLNQLQHINPLLNKHHRRAAQRQDPGHHTVHFVRARHLHRARAEGTREEEGGGRLVGSDGGGGLVCGEARGGEEGGGDEGAAEAEEVEGYEEEFVEGAEGEEDDLRVTRISYEKEGKRLVRGPTLFV